MSFPDEKVVNIGGQEYRYFDVGDENACLQTIMLHGVASSKEVLLHRAKDAKLEGRVIYLDLPGTNGVSPDGFENFDQIAEYVGAFVEDFDFENVVLCGFSMGGMVTMKCGEVFKDKSWLKGIVAWASPLMGKDGIGPFGRVLLVFIKMVPNFLYKIVNSRGAINALSSLVGFHLSDIEVKIMNEFPLEYARKFAPRIADYSVVPNWEVPSLLLYGMDDPLVSKSNAKLVQGDKCENVEVDFIERGGHFYSKVGLNEVAKKIVKFIAGVSETVGKSQQKD